MPHLNFARWSRLTFCCEEGVGKLAENVSLRARQVSGFRSPRLTMAYFIAAYLPPGKEYMKLREHPAFDTRLRTSTPCIFRLANSRPSPLPLSHNDMIINDLHVTPEILYQRATDIEPRISSCRSIHAIVYTRLSMPISLANMGAPLYLKAQLSGRQVIGCFIIGCKVVGIGSSDVTAQMVVLEELPWIGHFDLLKSDIVRRETTPQYILIALSDLLDVANLQNACGASGNGCSIEYIDATIHAERRETVAPRWVVKHADTCQDYLVNAFVQPIQLSEDNDSLDLDDLMDSESDV